LAAELKNLQLFSAIHAFLDGPPEATPKIDFPPAQQAFETLSETRQAVRTTFMSQIQRPCASSQRDQGAKVGEGGIRLVEKSSILIEGTRKHSSTTWTAWQVLLLAT
jgi:hypothetical protein